MSTLCGPGGRPIQDDWVATRIGPHPWGIVESHMNVSDARRDSQSIGAEHRRKVQVLRTILDNRHAPGGPGPANGGSMTILAGGSLPSASGITWAGLHLSVGFCAAAVIASNAMAATDSRDVAFDLVRFVMFLPPMLRLVFSSESKQESLYHRSSPAALRTVSQLWRRSHPTHHV